MRSSCASTSTGSCRSPSSAAWNKVSSGMEDTRYDSSVAISKGASLNRSVPWTPARSGRGSSGSGA